MSKQRLNLNKLSEDLKDLTDEELHSIVAVMPENDPQCETVRNEFKRRMPGIMIRTRPAGMTELEAIDMMRDFALNPEKYAEQVGKDLLDQIKKGSKKALDQRIQEINEQRAATDKE